MNRTYLYRKFLKKTNFFVKQETAVFLFNSLQKSTGILVEIRSYLFLSIIKKNLCSFSKKNLSFLSKIRFRCLTSNRATILFKKIRLARHELKKFILLGFLEGFQKSS